MTDREEMKRALGVLEEACNDRCNAEYNPCFQREAIISLRQAIEQAQQAEQEGSPCPEFWDWLPKAYNFEGYGNFTKYNMEVAFLAGKQAQYAEQMELPEPRLTGTFSIRAGKFRCTGCTGSWANKEDAKQHSCKDYQ